MKVTILEPFGYCAGVELAMNKAISLADNGVKTCVLGMLVHNSDAIEELNRHKILTLVNKDKTLLDLVDEVPKGYTVVLTAHGHEKAIEDKLNQKGIPFVDATCPKVLLAETKILKALHDDHEVIFIGKKNHPEANAMLSFSPNIHLYEFNKKFDYSIIKSINPVVISQTTFSKDEIANVISNIKSVLNNAIIFDNVCNASKDRQDAIKNVSNDVDCIFVVGGQNSNNTRTLFTLAKKEHPNAKIFMIENASQINKKDLLGLNYCAISSGASTPKNITLEIKNVLETI